VNIKIAVDSDNTWAENLTRYGWIATKKAI
jgi:hypothetical protein